MIKYDIDLKYIIPKVEDLKIVELKRNKVALIDSRIKIEIDSKDVLKSLLVIDNEEIKIIKKENNTKIIKPEHIYKRLLNESVRDGILKNIYKNDLYINEKTADLPLFHNENFKYGKLKAKDVGFFNGGAFYLLENEKLIDMHKKIVKTIDEELIPEYKENKMEILEVCDKFRSKYKNGEKLWHEMMENKIQTNISLEAFVNKCNMDRFLDEDETFVEYIEYQKNSDPDFGIYESKMMNEDCMFFQVAGFEYIFVKNDFKDKLKKLENDENIKEVKKKETKINKK
jgi:hypothetical protein